MPTIQKKSLLTICDVSHALDYLGTGEHENHRNHAVEFPRYYGDSAKTKDEFVEELSRAIDFLNGERSPSNQLKKAATWWTAAFPMRSFLNARERSMSEAVGISAIGCSGFAAVSWHDNIFNGSADLNIIDPGIELGSIPRLRRSYSVNLLMRVRRQFDRWLHDSNTTRAEAGLQPIMTVSMAQSSMPRKTARRGLVELLFTAWSGNVAKLTVKNLQNILENAGLSPGDWTVDLHGRLEIRRLPGRPGNTNGRPIARFRMESLFREIIEVATERGISTEIIDTHGSDYKSHTPAPKNRNVSPSLRTTPDVIHYELNKGEIKP